MLGTEGVMVPSSVTDCNDRIWRVSGLGKSRISSPMQMMRVAKRARLTARLMARPWRLFFHLRQLFEKAHVWSSCEGFSSRLQT